MGLLRTFYGWAGAAELDNYFSFYLSSPATITVNLFDLTSNVVVSLFDANGNLIGDETGSELSDASLVQTLAPGTYYVNVVSQSILDYSYYLLSFSKGEPAVGTAATNSAGATLATARQLGALGATVTIADWVGSTHENDYYEFTLTSASTVNLSLSGLTNNAKLYLEDSEGDAITDEAGSANNNASIIYPLAAGTYFIEVNYAASASDGFSLSAGATPIVDTAGTLPSNAPSLGPLTTATRTITDFIGGVAADHYYAFTVGAASTVTLGLSGLAGMTYLALLGAEGNSEIASTSGSDTSNASLIEDLAAGAYFIDVSYGEANSDYTLTASAAVITHHAGTSIATAVAVTAPTPSVPQTVSDYAGAVYEDNFYKFTLTSSATVTLHLYGVSQSAGETLTNSSGLTIDSSLATTVYDGSTVDSLAAGTYYIEIVNGTALGTNYTLTLSDGPVVVGTSATNIAGTSLATAAPLGVWTGPQVFKDWVGSTDPRDYYQFTLKNASSIDLQLAGVVATTDLYLLNSAGSILVQTFAYTTANGSIIDSLGPGTYYIEVAYGGTNTGYNLSATETALPGQAGATTSTAEALGTLTAAATTVSDYVGSTDPADYYSFTLSGPSMLNLTLGGLGQSASVELLNAAGGQIMSAAGGNTGNASIIDPLAAGTYFAEVTTGSSGTTYSLSASAVALPVVGTTPATAFNITTALNEGPLPLDNYNATGRSDLLLQNTNGAIDIFTTSASGLALPSAVSAGDPGSAWHVVATADLDGDGQPDLLLQNDNGTMVDYLMNGASITAGYNLGNAGSSWHVRGTGDFSGDGNTDILMQNDSGSMVLFETNGQALIASSALGSLPAGWAVEGVGDFYGTGQPDLLVESTGGTLVLYTMSGTAITAGKVIATVGAGWSVAGVADYNGDGKADIVLHNDNGSNVLFGMSGSSITSGTALGDPGASYTNAVAGLDLNGDSVPDLVVQNTASMLVGYTLNSNAQITAGAVLGTPGAGWNIVGSNPTTFIDGTGANLTLAATAGPDQFNLTSYAAGIHTITGFDPALDSVALSAAAFPSYATVQANEAPYMGGTFINLSPAAAIVIQGVTPSQLSAANFILR